MINNLVINDVLNKTTTTIQSYGMDISGYEHLNKKAQQIINEAPEEMIQMIHASLVTYNEIIEAPPLKDESELNINKRHLREFLKRHKLKVSEKIFESMEHDHIVEVYAKNHQQIFRTVNFFNLSNYSLESLTFLPWDELYSRADQEMTKLFSFAEISMDQGIEMVTPELKPHIITELETEKRFRYTLHKFGCIEDEIKTGVMGYVTMIKVSKTPEFDLL